MSNYRSLITQTHFKSSIWPNDISFFIPSNIFSHIEHERIYEIKDWCTLTFGEQFNTTDNGKNNCWCLNFDHVNSTIYFKNSEMATLFLMRWQ
jgi:hypothetical protein